jgi:hypothetical protein
MAIWLLPRTSTHKKQITELGLHRREIRDGGGGVSTPIRPPEVCGAMRNGNRRMREILSGILLLAARPKGAIPVSRIHSILNAMKTHESILSGLHFSLTGDVCYSREIDHAIGRMVDDGFLRLVDGSVSMGENARELSEYLSGFLTEPQIQAVHSVSIRFHERLRRDLEETYLINEEDRPSCRRES